MAGEYNAYTPTQSDAMDDPDGPFSALWVGGTGNVKVTAVGGTVAVFTAVPAGTYLSIRIRRVWSTGTTATNMIGQV